MRHGGSAVSSGRVVLCARTPWPRAGKRPRFDPTSDTWCHRLKVPPSILPFEGGWFPRCEPVETTSCGQDSPPWPGLGAMTMSHTCLTPSTDPHRKRRDGSFISQSVRSAKFGSSLRVVASEELCPASGLGSGLHRASACSAGAPRRRECREKGPANDDHDEYPARTAMRPVELAPPKRIVPPDGMRSLDGDTHPLALP